MNVRRTTFEAIGTACVLTSLAFCEIGDPRAMFSPDPPTGDNFCATGLAFDGSSLYVNRCSDSNIYRISPVDGGVLSTFDPGILELPAAMAYDGKRNGLWIGTQRSIGGGGFLDCGSIGMPIYFWDFDDGSVNLMFPVSVSLSNPATGELFLQSCFLNGLTYVENSATADADDELWIADDRNHNIAVFRPDGEFVTGFDALTVNATMTNCTGLAIAAELLYMNNDGFGGVFQTSRIPNALGQLMTGSQLHNGSRWETDMECDSISFAPDHVLWVRSSPQCNPAFDPQCPEKNIITAYEVAPGGCGSGSPLGACCDPTTATCGNNVSAASCSGTWVEGATCPDAPGCEAHMVVLLDRTGSMNEPRCVTGNTRCFDALETAKMDVNQFFATHSSGSSLAVWTFANEGPVNLTGGFVTDAQVASDALAALDGVPCDGVTPLAESMCDAVDSLVAAFPAAPPNRSILAVSSDGGENFSDENCSGSGSMDGDSCATYNPSSWQRQVCDRIIGNAIAQVRHWATFDGCDGMAASDIDPETGLVRGGGVPDTVFFGSLAAVTGGSYVFLEDSPPPPPVGTPIFGVTGACCLPNGTCQEAITEAECAVLGGMHQGEDSTCASAMGGCCLSDGSCQDAITQTACTGQGGIFQGACTTCADDVIGACCLAGGICQDGLTPAQCAAQNGTYQGACSVCTGAPGECEVPIPTVSKWGSVVMTLLVLTAGTVVLRRRMDNMEQQPG